MFEFWLSVYDGFSHPINLSSVNLKFESTFLLETK